jgi:alpha-tubulin suppressor-like RCC1 family protein
VHRRIRLTALIGLLVGALAATATPAPAAGQAEAVLSGVTAITVGDDHTCALLGTGQVRCWGDNVSGQLGNDALGVDAPVPVAVRNVANTGNLTGVTQIDAGDDHTCARLNTGRAVCWGEGGSSQLGDGGGVDRDTPVAVRNAANTADLTGIAQVSAGDLHTCARLTNGRARCWGDNNAGQIGNGDAPNDAFTARAVRNATDTAELGGVLDIDAGGAQTCALVAGAQVRCWGSALDGRLGNNSTTPDRDLPVTVRSTTGGGALRDVAQLDVGANLGCARLTNARAVCWGNNASGELGDGTDSDSLFPQPVSNTTGDGPLRGVGSIDAGSGSSCARLTNGQARCWGFGTDGQLGDGEDASSRFPVVVRNVADTGPLRNVVAVVTSTQDHSCALLSNQQVRCWGDNDAGQLGNDDVGVDALVPVVVHPA